MEQMQNTKESRYCQQSWYRERRLSSIMEIGELLLESGAEVDRVEDTISRLCQAYGYARADVFCIISSIIVTVHCPDGEILTQTRRITRHVTDLGRVEKLNDLSRHLCERPETVERTGELIAGIRAGAAVPPVVTGLMYAMISAAFALFFGGNAVDAVCASLSGLVLFLALTLLGRLGVNNILADMICCAFTGLVVFALVRAGLGQNPDMIMIGNIMLVIPGVQLTTSLRDIINGDLITGLMGMSEAALKAIAVAMGFAAIAGWLG